MTLPAYDETATVTTLTLVAAVLRPGRRRRRSCRAPGACGRARRPRASASVALLVPTLSGSRRRRSRCTATPPASPGPAPPAAPSRPRTSVTDVGAAWLLPVCVAAILSRPRSPPCASSTRLARRCPVRARLAVVAGLLALSGVGDRAALRRPGVDRPRRPARRGRPPRSAWRLARDEPVPVSPGGRPRAGGRAAVVRRRAPHRRHPRGRARARLRRARPVPRRGSSTTSRPGCCRSCSPAWCGARAPRSTPSAPWSGLVGLLAARGAHAGPCACSTASGATTHRSVRGPRGLLPALRRAAAGRRRRRQRAGVDETSSWARGLPHRRRRLRAAILALLRADRRQVGWLGGLPARRGHLGPAGGPRRRRARGLHAAHRRSRCWWSGCVHLRRHPAAVDARRALGAGLALALVPSLLWVLVDPTGLRAVLLGLACLALVVAGVQAALVRPARCTAPSSALVVVLREAARTSATACPRWALIGAAGALLIGLGRHLGGAAAGRQARVGVRPRAALTDRRPGQRRRHADRTAPGGAGTSARPCRSVLSHPRRPSVRPMDQLSSSPRRCSGIMPLSSSRTSDSR